MGIADDGIIAKGDRVRIRHLSPGEIKHHRDRARTTPDCVERVMSPHDLMGCSFVVDDIRRHYGDLPAYDHVVLHPTDATGIRRLRGQKFVIDDLSLLEPDPTAAMALRRLEKTNRVVEITGTQTGDSECWCLEVDPQEYREVFGEEAYAKELKAREDMAASYCEDGMPGAAETELTRPWWIYPSDLFGNHSRIRIHVKVEELD